jgi:steroid 5-alpha reductase family enzyme
VSGHIDVLASAAVAVVVLMIAAWIVSLVRHDAGIADIAWGIGLLAVTVVAALVGDGDPDRSYLLVALVAIWALRLSGHIWWRSRGGGEDRRYEAMRRSGGANFPARSLVTVFGLQGLLMWIVSLPVQLAMTPATPHGVSALAVVGTGVWGLGLFFESVGDAQLARFRANPENSGEVMDRGLWRLSRHPNYFGDLCIWWGLFLVAAETTDARYGIVGPIVMSALIMKVSGVPLLERSISERRPGYTEYAARTRALFPGPRRGRGDR